MILRREGNLFDYRPQAYAHGVNTQGRMGQGIAIKFKQTYPDMFRKYEKLCDSGLLVPGDIFFYDGGDRPSVYNLATQSTRVRANTEFLRSSIERMHAHAREHDVSDIAMPEIGLGLGGLESEALTQALIPFEQDSTHHVTVVTFKGRRFKGHWPS